MRHKNILNSSKTKRILSRIKKICKEKRFCIVPNSISHLTLIEL